MSVALLVGGESVTAGTQTFPVHTDARGTLLAVEGLAVGFPVQRVFTVRGTAARTPRGGHAPGCHELLVLVSGRVTGSVRTAGSEVAFDLSAVGQSVRVSPTDAVDYALDEDSVLLVVCDRRFKAAL